MTCTDELNESGISVYSNDHLVLLSGKKTFNILTRRKSFSRKGLAVCKKERQTGRNDPPSIQQRCTFPLLPPIPSLCSSFLQTNKQTPILNCRYSIYHRSLVPALKLQPKKMPSPTHQPTQQSHPVQQPIKQLSSIADLAISSLSLSAPAPSCACTSNWQHSYFNCPSLSLPSSPFPISIHPPIPNSNRKQSKTNHTNR